MDRFGRLPSRTSLMGRMCVPQRQLFWSKWFEILSGATGKQVTSSYLSLLFLTNLHFYSRFGKVSASDLALGGTI